MMKIVIHSSGLTQSIHFVLPSMKDYSNINIFETCVQ